MTSRPRVLFDATAIPANRGGVGRYVDALLQELHDADEFELLVACQQRDAERFRKHLPHAEVLAQSPRISSTSIRLLWEQLMLPSIARRHHADLIHSPHYTMPLLTGRPRVVTCHDATFFSEPALHGRIKRIFFRWWIRRSAAGAAAVLTISQASATELAKYARFRHGIRVTLLGVDTARFRPPTAAERDEFAINHQVDSWIGFLGTLEPRKNIPALIRGYRSAIAGRSTSTTLLLAGAAGWDAEVQLALDEPGPGEVRALGYLPFEELPAFLGGAELVAYPSLGEGFGLPVAEAMATGAAVLTTRRLALPEVGGDAVAYCEPDTAAIATAIARLLGDPQERTRLRALALERASQFTWKRTEELTADAYRAVLGDRR